MREHTKRSIAVLAGLCFILSLPAMTSINNGGYTNVITAIESQNDSIQAQYMSGIEIRITTDPEDQDMPDIHGDRIVWEDWRNGGCDIYMYDFSTGTETQITTNPASQLRPAIHGDFIVWEDHRDGNSDIYMYSISTGYEAPIATGPAYQSLPAIHGDRIVWSDSEDIYMYDLSTGTETQITTDLTSQYAPAIYGDCIVWLEYVGIESCNIVMYDITTGTETQITTNLSYKRTPVIYGDHIVWADQRCGRPNWVIYMYEISTGIETQISPDPVGIQDQWYPDIYDNLIVWQDVRHTDPWEVDVFMHDLLTGTRTQIPLVLVNQEQPTHYRFPRIHGSRIAYMDYRESNQDIYVYDLAFVPQYTFGGILQPINADGSSLFKQGRTVPVKFQLFDDYGLPVSTAHATIGVTKTDDGTNGEFEEITSTSAADTGNVFRYDPEAEQYIYNLSTKELEPGTYVLIITLDDGQIFDVQFSLR